MGLQPFSFRKIPMPLSKIARIVRLMLALRGVPRLFSIEALCFILPDDHLHSPHFPPDGRGSIYAERFCHQGQGDIIKADGSAHSGHAQLRGPRLEKFPSVRVAGHEIRALPFAPGALRFSAFLGSGFPARFAEFRAVAGKPFPDGG